MNFTKLAYTLSLPILALLVGCASERLYSGPKRPKGEVARLHQGVDHPCPLAEIDSVKVKGGGIFHFFALAPGRHSFKSKPFIVQTLGKDSNGNPLMAKTVYIYSGSFNAEAGGTYQIDVPSNAILQVVGGGPRGTKGEKVAPLDKVITESIKLP